MAYNRIIKKYGQYHYFRPMNYLSVDRISKSFGERILFENVSMGLSKGDKMALIAPNGAGKSTLLKILAGKESADSGEVAYRQNLKVSFLNQDPEFKGHLKLSEFIKSAHSDTLKLIEAYHKAAEKQAENPSPEEQKEFENLSHDMEEKNAWDYDRQLKSLINLFGLDDLEMEISALSGGQKKRLALAMLLLDNPDLIVLDEPTNHLDIEMIEWLEEYLSASHISLLMVTHDRYFLDRVCNQILELEDQKVYIHKGNYSYYLEKKASREEAQAAEVAKAKQLMKKELEWIRRMPKARGTKAKYRIDAFEATKNKAKSGKKEVDFNLEAKMQRLGGKILELKKVSKAFDDLKILNDFTYTFKKGERIGVVGPNGVGKSTFLNLIAGELQAESGKIIPGQTLSIGYYTQRGIRFKEEDKMIDIITKIAEVIEMADGSKVSASQFLNMFHFPPKQQQTPVSKLSGGEKRRLYLLTVLIKNPNFLILDEPTNDLDILTLNRLEEFLLNFKGCLLMVSHDRYFMDKLVDHLFVFEGEGEVRDFNGSYSAYREDLLDRKEKEEKVKAEKKVENAGVKAKDSEKSKKKRSYKEQVEFEALEKEIENLEEEKAELEASLSSGIEDYEKITKISERISEIIDLLDEKMMRWLELDDLN